MEWVETTGKTLEEAREAALDQLGVDEIDAEFEVLEQPKAGLFGRVRGEARVRARVKPTAPRAKEDRRDRRRRGKPAAKDGASVTGREGSAAVAGAPVADAASPAGPVPEGPSPGGSPSGGKLARPASAPGEGPAAASGTGTGTGTGQRRRRRRGRSGGGGAAGISAGDDVAGSPAKPDSARSENGGSRPPGAGNGGRRPERTRTAGDPMSESNERRDGTEVEVPLQDQGRVAEDFLSGLINEFGLTADITVTEREEENLDLALSGHDLGLLIGQKGATLLAVQDLTRTVVQHKTNANNGRIHVDIGGYRQKRAEALAKFANEVADKVRQTGQRTALEPMSAADRKVVHDTITGLDGVSTISEGEEPRRRVVILPAE